MEDIKIIELYFARDERAIFETSEKYGKYCTAIATNILGNAEDSKECVNDTYLSVWNAIPPKRPALFRTFIGKITRNIAFNKFRYGRRNKRGGGECALILDELAECVSDNDTPEIKIERYGLVSEINSFLEHLSEKQRGLFVCRYWYFESIDSIAKRFSMSESNVYTTLSRLREKLRNHLTEGGYEI